MDAVVDIPSAIEPSEWFIVFHRKSVNRILSFLAFGELKHVSAFGYCPGVKLWLLYDVRWSGTRVMLLDKAAIMAWTEGCDILKIERGNDRMGMTSRFALYCVPAIKHLLRLKCVAATPDGLYRHILRNGGIAIATQGSLISGQRPTPALAGRSESGDRAAAGAG
jgi:hypothetical protein